MSRLLITLALPFSVVALFMLIWIVVPAPHYRLWQLAVGAGEWSLWFGLLALLGVALGVIAMSHGWRWPAWSAIGVGLIAIGLSLVPPLVSLPVARAHGAELSLRQYFLGGESLPDVTVREITFATVAGQPLRLDHYAPIDSQQPRPAIIVIHGGSWSGGSKSDLPRWNRWLVSQGFAVFDIEYRLGPQPNWQTATGDIKCAIGWVKQNAADLNIDPDRIALLGRSAGGHLALLAAYTPGHESLPPSCPSSDTSVRAVISLYGPADLVWGYNNPANPDVIDGPGTLRRFLGGTPDSARDAFVIASPVTHVDSQTPPTLLLHGSRDQLVGQRHAEILADRLTAAGVTHETVFVPYGQHGFDFNFNGWGSQIAQATIRRFLRAHLNY
jgi:acetyl esterase/lipase